MTARTIARGWRRRLTALLLLALATGCGDGVSPEYATLARFAGGGAGLDWREMHAACRGLGIETYPPPPGPVRRILARVGVPVPAAPRPSTAPYKIVALPDGRIVVVSGAASGTTAAIPSACWQEFHLVRKDGRVSRSGRFRTGWSYCPLISCVRLSGITRFGIPLLRVGGGGGPIQHYAVLADRFALVRVEGPITGTIMKNDCYAPNLMVGPVASRGREGWLRLLGSDHPAEVLEALTWLAGVHLDPEPPHPDYVHEDPATARLWHDLISDDAVRRRIGELWESPEPWISETARLAAEVKMRPRSW